MDKLNNVILIDWNGCVIFNQFFVDIDGEVIPHKKYNLDLPKHSISYKNNIRKNG